MCVHGGQKPAIEGLGNLHELLGCIGDTTGLIGLLASNAATKYTKENLSISEEVIKAAAGNTGDYGHEALTVIFRHAGENLSISEEIVRLVGESLSPRKRKRSQNLPAEDRIFAFLVYCCVFEF